MALPRTRRQGGSPAVAEQWDPRTPHLGSPAPLWAGPGQGRPLSGGDEGPPGPPLTWASSALHTSCSLSGVMSTGTSNGEPSSCPPSSWNCTSSRCTSHAAASSCAHKGGGQSRRPTGKPPPPPPSGSGDPGPERPRPHSRTPTSAAAAAIPRPHVEEKDSGGTERRPRGRAARQPATSPSGVAEGKCHAVSGPAWPWAYLVPTSPASSWTGGRRPIQYLPVPCRMQTAFCLCRTGILAPLHRWGNQGSEGLTDFPQTQRQETVED